MTTSVVLSPVEQAATAHSPFQPLYAPAEKIPVIVVDNFPELGKLVAMRFMEWVQENPEGLIALPTGKTPEHFIRWVQRILRDWDRAEMREELERSGVNPGRKPNLRGLGFVQIDEFYPIDPSQQNSFFHYVNQFYLEGFGLDPGRAMLMDGTKIGMGPGDTLKSVWPDDDVDLSLEFRQPATALELVQKRVIENIVQWCQEYEERIRERGGIGFFLGGIGPDGHIGFNVRGSDHHGTTRLTPVNYETQAAAAGDLGGIEVARKRLVITIGLGTITFNPRCVAIIMAAGEAKAGVVADAIQHEAHVSVPASALRVLPRARFYITRGAAKQLGERRLALLRQSGTLADEEAERILVDLSVRLQKRLLDLGRDDLTQDPEARLVLEKGGKPVGELVRRVHDSLAARIEKGAAAMTGKCFVHTEPHHDDLMLGCLPFIVRHTRSPQNRHYFATLTSGFTAVANPFMRRRIEELQRFLDADEFRRLYEQKYFDPGNGNGRQRDVWQYLDGVAGGNRAMKEEGAARRLARDLGAVFGDRDPASLRSRAAELLYYLDTQYPGKKDPEAVQKLKGMCREWEAECLWGYFGWKCSNVFHLRLGFYSGDIFVEEPSLDRDVPPVSKLLREMQPDVVSVALDPEASGPDTHYKVLQAVVEALRRYEEESGRRDVTVYGYRNVWFRFHPSEANVYVPVSLNMFSVMRDAFMNTFVSQKDASFPSHEHDGPFCELAQKIQVEQYQKIKTCLGREWFHDHPSAMIRATRGLVFLREFRLAELYQTARALRRAAENR